MYFWFLVLAFVTGVTPHSYGSNTNKNHSSEVLLSGQLIFAHVLFRHGDRMPLLLCPNDPWNRLEHWPNDWGELSALGVQQHYNLGQWLRRRFASLLSSEYKPSEIYVRSTDVDRALMSAQANLAGLYPSTENNTSVPWQPVPIHSTPLENDFLMGKAPCQEHQKDFVQYKLSEEYQDWHQRSQHIYQYYTKHCGRTVNTLQELQYMWDKFRIEETYNKTVPSWARPIYGSEELQNIAYYVFSIKTQTRKMARLKAGPLLKDMLDRMRLKANLSLVPYRNVWIYSGHDTTIANLLNALKMFKLHAPGYAAALSVELRLDGRGRPFVSIFYKNNWDSEEAELLSIPGCGFMCPLEEMFTLYEDILPDNIAEECNPTDVVRISMNSMMNLLASLLVFMVVILCVVVCHEKKSTTHF